MENAIINHEKNQKANCYFARNIQQKLRKKTVINILTIY